MKNKKLLMTLIATFLYVGLFAQSTSIIKYSVQLKGQEYEYNEGSYESKQVVPYTFLDSAQMAYLAKSYINVLFTKKDSELLSSDNYNISIENIDIPEILNPDKYKDTTKEHFYIKGDTLFFKGDISEYSGIYNDFGIAPYTSIDAKFNFIKTTEWLYDPATGEEISRKYIESKSFPEQFGGFQFYETWNYNAEKGIFNKEIENSIPFYLFRKVYEEGRYYGGEGFYFRRLLDCYFQPKQTNPTKLLAENIIYDVKIISNSEDEYEDGGDIYYSENNYLKTTNRNDIILGLLDNAKTGKIKAYNLKYDDKLHTEVPDFSKKIKTKKMLNILSYTTVPIIAIDTTKLIELEMYKVVDVIIADTTFTKKIKDEYKNLKDEDEIEYLIYDDEYYEYDENGDEVYSDITIEVLDTYKDTIYTNVENWHRVFSDTIIKTYDTYIDTTYSIDEEWRILDKRFESNSFDTIYHNTNEDIYGFRFYEDWYFDENTFAIKKKVNGVALIVAYKTLNKETKKYEYVIEPKIYFKLN